jgi:hypothetical protein
MRTWHSLIVELADLPDWLPACVRRYAAVFASAGQPTLAPIHSSAAFLVAYQDIRGLVFTAVEQETAWAASLWPAAHNARWEHCTATRRCPAMRCGHKRPNASTGQMPKRASDLGLGSYARLG